MKERGFTLLEVLVATLIMGVAVVSLLSSVSTSLRNASRVVDYDRVTLLARAQMDSLLLSSSLQQNAVVQGEFDPAVTGGREAGWRARMTPFEMPNRGAGAWVLQRIELEVWWMAGADRRTFTLDGFRRRQLRPGDLGTLGGQVNP
jgi:general secretion pathway protein I